MKKVLVIAPYSYLPYFSGGQKFIARFLHYLGKEVELTVVSVKENDFSMAENYEAIPLLKKSITRYIDRGLIKKLEALIKKKQIDSLVCEHPYFAWLAFALKKSTGVKVIIHTHNIEYQRFRSAGKWWWPVLKGYEKRSFQKADSLLFISPQDREFAEREWKIPAEKCIDLPYGIEITGPPIDKHESRNYLESTYGIAAGDKILLFAGLLNYEPNVEAVNFILRSINPILLSIPGYHGHILICGKGLPPEIIDTINSAGNNLSYAGFVEDIQPYFKGADIFLNPVMKGGGVKTKIIEAIAAGTTVISTETGAIGMEKTVCGDKLVTVKDKAWQEFANKIVADKGREKTTPGEFYQYYYFGNIIKRLLEKLK